MGRTLILQSGMPAVAGTSDAEGVGLVLLWLNSTQRGHVSDQVVESLVGESSCPEVEQSAFCKALGR